MMIDIDTGEALADRVRAGLSFQFVPGRQPDCDTFRVALEACQAPASVVREDREAGRLELVASGLAFDVSGLAPADEPAGVRFYPGHHLSGGVALRPVVHAMLMLAAELATHLPATSVTWHPAGVTSEPAAFSRATLAWLAGGAFPAQILASLSRLEDGTVVSRGMVHFLGQELSLRGGDVRLASQVLDLLMREGLPRGVARIDVAGHVVNLEPAPHAGRLLAWTEGRS